MRARLPDRAATVERDGVQVAFEVYGQGQPAVLLVPAAPITHARSWKGIAPSLARHFTVVTTDLRGTGRSDRPHTSERYSPDDIWTDLDAVLDAAKVNRAIVVAHCHAVPAAVRLATNRPERVAGLVAIAPHLALAPPPAYSTEAEQLWPEHLDCPTGWHMRNRDYWRQEGGYRQWIEFFFHQQLPEAHSTKQYEDTVHWAMETDPDAMIAEREGRGSPSASEAEALCRQLECPVLVLHGDEDRCQPLERGWQMAELTGGELVVLHGAGHLPHARDPVQVIRLINKFVQKTTGAAMHTTTWTRGLSRPKRALYLSSPIGLGHARRDVAVAKELKRLRQN